MYDTEFNAGIKISTLFTRHPSPTSPSVTLQPFSSGFLAIVCGNAGRFFHQRPTAALRIPVVGVFHARRGKYDGGNHAGECDVERRQTALP